VLVAVFCGLLQFALWIKQNVIAGWPVIAGFRLKYGTYADYDHIM
jgi:hypothetical protein